jgi:YD repeat-containing protein
MSFDNSLSRVCGRVTMIGATSLALFTGTLHVAESSTLYSYDAQNRLIQETDTTGISLQFQYDSNGNLVKVTAVTPSALALGAGQSVQIASGAEALYTFTVGANQGLSLITRSITTSPGSAPVNISVFNSSGMLVGSGSTATGATLNLPTLATGTYTVVVAPQNSATASLQLTLARPVAQWLPAVLQLLLH